MILYLDTSTPVTKLWLDEQYYEYKTDRTLARDLLRIITENLPDFSQLTALVVYRGPGSFTGLRIGLTVCNALADQLSIPIVGTTGPNWRKQAQSKLKKGQNDRLILPEYGKPANITTPKK